MNDITPVKNYSLRPSTQHATQAQNNKGVQRKKPRVILPLECTPSLISGSGHDCKAINPEHTKTKAQNRIIYSYLRITIAKTWECTTERGSTEMQGYSSNCGGCQSAHWSLTPCLRDNKLEMVMEEVKNKGLFAPDVTPGKAIYLKNTLSLTPEELKELDENHDDLIYFDNFLKRHVSSQQWKQSFKGTALEQLMNGICEGPTASNNVDSQLECKIRKKEDEICDLVKIKQLDSKKGIANLVDEIIKYYILTLQNLELRIEQLERFFDLEKNITAFEVKYGVLKHTQIDQGEFAKYIDWLRQFLRVRKELNDSLIGATKYKKVSAHRQDFYTLQLIVNKFDEVRGKKQPFSVAIKFFLSQAKTFKRREIDHTEVMQKYNNLYNETVYQFQATLPFSEEENIDKLDRLIFGIYDSEKKSAEPLPLRKNEGNFMK